MTAILWSSSIPVHRADRAIREGDVRRLKAGLAAGFVLGATFLIMTFARRVAREAHDEFGPTTNVYGSLFFTITGFHAAHVLVGLLFSLGPRPGPGRAHSTSPAISPCRTSPCTGTSSTSCGRSSWPPSTSRPQFYAMSIDHDVREITRQEGRGSAALWFAVLGSPVGVGRDLGLNYPLEEVVACAPATSDRGEILGLTDRRGVLDAQLSDGPDRRGGRPDRAGVLAAPAPGVRR